MLHTGSVPSMSSSTYQSSYQHHSSKPRSPSISASSVVTVHRTASPAATPGLDTSASARNAAAQQLQSEDSLLTIRIPTSSFSRSPSPGVRTAAAAAPQQISDGVGNLNRWSQSTTSSAGPLDSPQRVRTSSGTPGPSMWDSRNHNASHSTSSYTEDLSPRSVLKHPRVSPMKAADQHRRNAPSFDKPLPPSMPPLSALQIPFNSVASPNESDILLTANSFTPSSAGLLTPMSYSAFDYFGSGALNDGSSKREGPSAARHNHHSSSAGQSLSSVRNPSRHHRHHPSSSVEDVSPGESSDRRPRARDRREKDKKTMLSKALEKANTAVLLDNALNYEGALDAYQDACRLLSFVMDRTSGAEDKRKLDAIRDTYTIRIDELLQLQATTHYVNEQKRLPPRPMSNESLDLAPQSNVDEAMSGHRDSAVIATATITRIVEAPAQTSKKPRTSFLTDAIREVEGSSSGGFLGPLWERNKSPFRESTFSEHTARAEELEENCMPRPLTPRHAPPSHDLQEEHDREADAGADTDAPPVHFTGPTDETLGTDTADPVSWLDTIDESGSDRSSMRSHRNPTVAGVGVGDGDTELDFDAAFDAAVEAAYEDGYMPDLDALQDTGHGALDGSAIQPIDLEIPPPPEGYSFPTDTEEDLDDEAEDERILDDITRDYIDHGFDFDMQSKSALPRQSDSSVFSRSTWQSSVVSNRTTAGTSLSTVSRSVFPDPGAEELQFLTSALDSSQSALLPETLSGQSSTRPLSVISEGSRSVQDRRSTGPNFKHLKIETARKPLDQWVRAPLAAVEDEPQKGEKQSELGEDYRASDRPISEVPSLRRFDKRVVSPPNMQPSTTSDAINGPYSLDSSVPPSSGDTISGARSPRPRLFRKNKSSISLRDHSMLITEEPSDGVPPTPLSASYAPSFAFNDHGQLTGRRPHITPSVGSYLAARDGLFSTGVLFDTSLGTMSPPTSPKSHDSQFPLSLESCPESALLRPFWLLRCISSTINHPRGGYLTTRLFVPREVWKTPNVKLKNIDDKIANCDLLTAALGKLASVDTYDADAVLEELQSFEEVMERVQAIMIKRLGSEVGVKDVNALFKDATSTEGGAVTVEGRDGPKTNSGKSYLSSWRKLRSKNSGIGVSSSTGIRAEKEGATMPSVPMTSFVPVEKRTAYKRDGHQDTGFEGPLKEYMISLGRLCEAAQVLDQVARQVEDPGLKHSSPTHVGLELSTRHAAEFFGFYICRFALADIGILLDKFVKRSTEWVLS